MEQASGSPKVDGVDAVFWHIDDVEWSEVRRQRNTDGTESRLQAKWPTVQGELLSVALQYDAGMVVPRHAHRNDQIVFLLDGGAWIGGEWYERDTHIDVPAGAAFGPVVAGPDGATFWELTFGDWSGWVDRPELFDRELAERGVTVVASDQPADPRSQTYWGSEPMGARSDGEEVRIRRMGEVEWTEVKRQRNADGSESAIREKWPILRPDFLSAFMEYDPGMITRRHGHLGHHVVWILAGGCWFGDRWSPVGTHIDLPLGGAFGPIIAGDEGTMFLEITDGDFRGWGDQPELYEAAIAAHGVTPMPDPPIDLGPWFEDKRGYWAPEPASEPASPAPVSGG